MKNVLIISSSPRKKGNSQILCEQFKKGAEAKVDPRYTSQCCPCCGHVEKSNRSKKIHLFTCKNCGYKSNDDRIGAMNLCYKGCCQPPYDVTPL